MLDHDTSKALYDLLDRVLGGQSVPPGAKGLLYRVVDQLRVSPGDGDQLRIAEYLSLELHRLEATLFSRDAAATARAYENLKTLAASWVQSRISSSNRKRADQVSNIHPLSVLAR